MKKALVAYTFTVDCGANKAGDVVNLDSDMAAALVEAGILKEASEEEVNGKPEEEVDDEAPVAAAVRALSSKIESAVAKATEAVVAKAGKATARPTIPAEVAKPIHKSFGHWAWDVMRSECGDREARKRLEAVRQKAPAGHSEGTAADGGELVPVEYGKYVLDKMRSPKSLFSMCTNFPATTNTLKIPAVNESSRADGSRWGGVRAYVVGEGNSLTGSKAAFTNIELTLYKIAVLWYATSELLEDNQYAFEKFMNDIIPEEMTFKVNDLIINGTGSSQPTGILAGASLVTVNKEGSQTATTINYQNIVKMYSRMYPESVNNAVWFVNVDVLPQLFSMTFPNASGTAAAYMPNNGYINSAVYAPAGTLLGRPVIPIEHCPTLGTKGDIIFADMTQYVTLYKEIGAAMSMHLKFDTDDNAFRFIFRFDGEPWWPAALTPFKGSNTVSPFVCLQTRS